MCPFFLSMSYYAWNKYLLSYISYSIYAKTMIYNEI